MVGALAGGLPVAEHEVEVEEPALHDGCARLDASDGALGERNGRQAGRAGQAFLAAGIHRIDAPFVHIQRRAAQAGDAIHDGERAEFLRDLAERLGVALRAGRGFGMHEGEDLCIRIRLEGVAHLVRIDRRAPGVVDDHRHAAGAFDVFQHTAAEHAVAADDHLVAWLHQVDETHFHPRRAWRRDREGQRVLGLERHAQHGLDLFHQVDERGVEVADGRTCHGIEDALGHVGGPRAHEDALGWDEGSGHNLVLFVENVNQNKGLILRGNDGAWKSGRRLAHQWSHRGQ